MNNPIGKGSVSHKEAHPRLKTVISIRIRRLFLKLNPNLSFSGSGTDLHDPSKRTVPALSIPPPPLTPVFIQAKPPQFLHLFNM